MTQVEYNHEYTDDVDEIQNSGMEMAQLQEPCNWSDLKTKIIDELTMLLCDLNELQTFQFVFDTSCCVQNRVVKCKGSLLDLIMDAGFDLKCRSNQFNLENWRKQKRIEVEEYYTLFKKNPFDAFLNYPHKYKIYDNTPIGMDAINEE